jgi:N-methylhydantoinase A
MMDIFEVGTGGGSIARSDDGTLRVGPQSAGAQPGPACYGQGGEAPTVTDANVVLGALGGDTVLAGSLRLDAARAEKAIETVAKPLGLDVLAGAAGILRIVNTQMAVDLRLALQEQGQDPRKFALVAFGGAGPLHACALAEELGIRDVLVPDAAGVLSAVGLVASDERRDRVESRLVPLHEAGELPRDGEADLRYAGQSFELTVPLADDLAAAFHRAHEERYGYADRARPIELVAIRTADVRRGPSFDLPRAAELRVEGPHVLEQSGSTVFVPPGWVGVRDGSSTLRVTRA